jgi:signal transduction histidine kinase
MSVVSIALGWLIAGRVLAPLRTMTQQTRRISERSLHERLALQGPGDELKELADTIDGLLARLEAAFDAQRRFIANASHELRTPLSMMRTSLDVASTKPGPIPPELTTLGVKLREGLDQADRLFESFLDLARAEHEQPDHQPSVSLAPLIVTTIDQRHHDLAAKRIAVERSIAQAHVPGSETLLARMLANLIDNAIRHNDPGGWVRIDAGANSHSARIAVQNGGQLLNQDEVGQLAQPFRRLGTERTGSRTGVGLGLSIVSAIATAHHGTLELRARQSGGMIATVELPLAHSNGAPQ